MSWCDPDRFLKCTRTMEKRFQGQIAVVTGASAGIGRALVRALAREGAHLGLLARGVAGLEGAAEEVRAGGGRAVVIPTDVSDHDQVERAAERVEEELGPIDLWINNAMV